ncbi:pentatricopeptide repeat-containing protein At5g06540-like [Triticum dicoccoides]|uniref:pentatricopeptide repeat-containing protein At5g06540-like n=1 Tax=Triticum dicoccoides TaxID=85692 RepID=UPI000E7B3B81|nr:pentatricopeptide repeat-containing protein At5g06540-like [Triticum dicoccoides]
MSAPSVTPIPITTISELKQHHSQLVRLGLASHPAHARRLLAFLARDPARLPYAARLLAHHPDPHPALFNPLFASLPPRHAAAFLSLMLSLPLHPDHFTLPRILPAAPLPLAAQLHALLLKLNFHSHAHSFNALLAAYLANARADLAFRLFGGGGSSAVLDVVSWTTMVGGLCRLGLVDDARELFDGMPERNLISWNAMISGYVKAGRFLDALEVFDQMRATGLEGNGFVAASAVVACTGAGALARGREVHRWVEQSGIQMDEKLATAVVDMYCKCGSVEEAWRVFQGLPTKGLTSWNCMIGGLAVHGRCKDAIELFHQMEREDVAPDDVTLVNLLTACAHTGNVSGGRHYFDYIVQRYGIEPKMEHYGCMVDLFGRAGLLDEAKKVIDDMPMEPDIGVLGALFGACKIHRDLDLGEAIGWRVIELDPQNSGRYVLLANLLASAGRWGDVAKVRQLMDERNVSKEAGRSVIEIDSEVCEFQCGTLRHPEEKEIFGMAKDMMRKIGLEGYAPDTSDVLHDVAEEAKEASLLYHSEKLAIAFGLLRMRPGDTMRVTKNLRVCRDCHEATKLISRVFEREIVVRDRNRFHHFRDGACSCNDYW